MKSVSQFGAYPSKLTGIE